MKRETQTTIVLLRNFHSCTYSIVQRVQTTHVSSFSASYGGQAIPLQEASTWCRSDEPEPHPIPSSPATDSGSLSTHSYSVGWIWLACSDIKYPTYSVCRALGFSRYHEQRTS